MLLTEFLKRLPINYRGELSIAFVRTFIARGITAVGYLALVVVIGRLYGPTGVGVLALAQSIILGAGIFARYGMDNALMRFVGQDPHDPHVLIYLRWAFIKVLKLSFLITLIIYFSRDILERIFQAEGLGSVLVGITIAIPAYTSAYLLSGFFKGIHKPVTATLLEGGSIALVVGILIIIYHWLMPDMGISIIGWAYALAAWLVLLQGMSQVLIWRKKNGGGKERVDVTCSIITQEKFFSTSNAFFIMSLANFMHSVFSIMIAGWMLNSSDLGLFKASQQVAMLISFILIVINAIIPPHFASLYHQEKYLALERLARQGAQLGLLLATPLLLICLIIPHWLLGLLGTEFQDAALMLQILSAAQLINVVTGSVGFLLNMTGYEKIMRNIVWFSSLTGILLLFILIPPFGALGASIALAVILVLQNLTAVVFVWRKLSIWILPIPNILHLLGIRSQYKLNNHQL